MRRLRAALVVALLLTAAAGCRDDEPTVLAVANCPSFGYDATALDPIVEILPDKDSVVVGDTFGGEAFFTNTYSRRINITHVGSVQVVLFHQGTTDPAAIFVGTLPSPALGLFLEPGETKALPINGGTVACGGPSRLAPGVYDMRVPLTAGLSDPFPITVAE